MTDETPAPLPPSSTPPYPAHEAPHPQRDAALEHLPGQLTKRMPERTATGEIGIGALGATLIGGAVAAAVGLLFAIPMLKRKPKKAGVAKPKARQTPTQRRTRRKRSEG